MGEPRSSYLGVMFQIWPPTKQIVELGVGLVNRDGFVYEFGPSTIWIRMFMVEVDRFLSLVGDIEGGMCHSNELAFWNFLCSWFSVK